MNDYFPSSFLPDVDFMCFFFMEIEEIGPQTSLLGSRYSLLQGVIGSYLPPVSAPICSQLSSSTFFRETWLWDREDRGGSSLLFPGTWVPGPSATSFLG